MEAASYVSSGGVVRRAATQRRKLGWCRTSTTRNRPAAHGTSSATTRETTSSDSAAHRDASAVHRAGLLAGFAAVLGHVTSPLLRGRGGKGVATAAGAILASHPAWAPVVLLTWVVVLAVARWTALASISAALALLVVSLVVMDDAPWAAALFAVVLVRHRPNLVRWVAARRA